MQAGIGQLHSSFGSSRPCRFSPLRVSPTSPFPSLPLADLQQPQWPFIPQIHVFPNPGKGLCRCCSLSLNVLGVAHSPSLSRPLSQCHPLREAGPDRLHCRSLPTGMQTQARGRVRVTPAPLSQPQVQQTSLRDWMTEEILGCLVEKEEPGRGQRWAGSLDKYVALPFLIPSTWNG